MEWKKFTDIHEISDTGLVRNLNTRLVLKTSINKGGYECIRLTHNRSQKSYSINRVVLQTFNPADDDSLECNHIDGNKLNNCLSNLEWCTKHNNIYHARNITGSGRVISVKKIKKLYHSNPDLTKEDFAKLLLAHCN